MALVLTRPQWNNLPHWRRLGWRWRHRAAGGGV